MKKLFQLALLLLFALRGLAQVSTVTATVTDSDSQTWNNGTYSIQLVSSTTGVAIPAGQAFRSDTGATITNTFSGTLSGSGGLSVALTSVFFITPSAVTWKFQVCPAVSTPVCGTTSIPVNSSGSISTQLNAVILAPRISGGQGAFAYADVEVASTTNNTYYNTTTPACRYYGNSWGNCGSGAGGGAVLPFPGIVYGTSSTAGTVATSSQIQTAIGPGVYTSTAALSGAKTSAQRPLTALYPHTWGFFAGVDTIAPSGTTVWPNAQGQLNITGTAGSGAITLNSITVVGSGGINDYCTTANWAAIIQHDDGTYGNYTVTSCNASTVNITPTLAKNVTAGNLWNLYNAVLGQHLTGQGYTGLAAWLFGLKKYQGYISQAAGGRYFDAGCNVYGTPMVLTGGLTTGGFIPGTSIAQGYFENAVATPSQIINNASGSSASTDVNATPLIGFPCRISVGAGTSGQGVTQTVNLGGFSGYLHFFVSVGGQNSTTPPSRLTVKAVVDGNTLQSTTSVAGLTEITVPYVNAWSGTVTITLTSTAATVFNISDLIWYVWPPSLNAALQDPMISPAANTITNMDSWGTQSSSAFPTALQSLLAANPLGASTGFTNTSLGGQTAIWAISNYATAVQPLHPDYAIYDYQINDLNTGAVAGYTISGGGSYGAVPTVSFTGGSCGTNPTATAILTGTAVTGLAFSQVGAGCGSTPTVGFSPSGATATVTLTPSTAAQLLTNIGTLTSLTLANGTTPIYLRSLNTSSSTQTYSITLAEQQFNTIPATITPPSVPAPGAEPAWQLQDTTAGPYTNFWDDFYTIANVTSLGIGSPTGNSCTAQNTVTDINHPGNLQVASGTASGSGESCNLSNVSQVTSPNNSLGWRWETAVYPSVLPGTTASSYQAALSHTFTNPLTGATGFYLSSANGVANDWYCSYGVSTLTQVDSTVAATLAWTRLTIINDGALVHWYINGTQVCGTGIALSNIATLPADIGVFTSVTSTASTSVNLYVDYLKFYRAVSR